MSALGSLGGRFGRFERISLVIALVWGTGLVIAALVVPVYGSSAASVSTSGPVTVTSGSATLVAVNGWGALLVAGVPLVAAVVTGGALWRRSGRPGAGALAWAVTGLLACFSLVGILTIGVFVIPVTAALAAACATHDGQPHRIAGGNWGSR